MKKIALASALVLWVGLAAAKAHRAVRAVPASTPRKLQQATPDWPFAFLVRETSDGEFWCIEAKHTTAVDAPIGISPCDFENAPFDQLWRVDPEGKIQSGADLTKCLIAEDKTGVSSNDYIRFQMCDISSDYNKFEHNKEVDQIKFKQDPSICMTHQGNAPQNSDSIRAQPCKNVPYFNYTYRDHECSTSLADVQCCDDNDCSGTDICLRSSYTCVEGKVDDCENDDDCENGEVCVNGACVRCSNDDDCPDDQICRDGACLERPPPEPGTDAVFLVSEDDADGDWCITASFGVGEFEEIGFEPCNFNGKPQDQLWYFESDGTIRSDVDQSRCLVVGPGQDLFSGLKIHIASCSLLLFRYDDRTGHIHLGEDDRYCLTPVGEPGRETIHAKSCENDDSFRFERVAS